MSGRAERPTERPGVPGRLLRRSVGVVASTVTLFAGLGLASTPAGAATSSVPVVSLQTPPDNAALAPGGSAQLQMDWIADRDLGTPTVMLTVDARGLAKVGTVTFAPECTAAGLVASCPEQMTLKPGFSWGVDLFTVTASKTAKLGATGRYTVSGKLAGAVVQGGSGVVTVGGPEYRLDQLGRHSNLRVGATFSQPVRFSNIGTRPAAGTDVVLQLSPGLRFTQHYRNCLYQTAVRRGVRYDLQAVCRFPDLMRIGEKVALAQPVRLQVTPQALWTYLDVFAEPAGVASLAGGGWHRGTGPVLGLKRLVAGKPSAVPPGTVQLPGDLSAGTAIVTARNGADYGVTGGRAKAVAGRDATIRVLMQNHGPAVLFDRSGGEATPFVKVTAPPGATVVAGPSCNTVSSTVEYCGAASLSAILAYPGDSFAIPVTFHVKTVVPHARGLVQLVWGEPVPSTRIPWDPNPRNNTAALILN